MIKITQFSTQTNSPIALAGKIGIHLKNQKIDKFTNLQKRFANSELGGNREAFIEAMITLFGLGRIKYYPEQDRVEYHEN